MPLPRPCKYCEQKFQPTSKGNKICEKCTNESKKKVGLNIRINNLKRKIRKHHNYLNVSSALRYSQSDIYKQNNSKLSMKEKKIISEVRLSMDKAKLVLEFIDFVEREPEYAEFLITLIKHKQEVKNNH